MVHSACAPGFLEPGFLIELFVRPTINLLSACVVVSVEVFRDLLGTCKTLPRLTTPSAEQPCRCKSWLTSR